MQRPSRLCQPSWISATGGRCTQTQGRPCKKNPNLAQFACKHSPALQQWCRLLSSAQEAVQTTSQSDGNGGAQVPAPALERQGLGLESSEHGATCACRPPGSAAKRSGSWPPRLAAGLAARCGRRLTGSLAARCTAWPCRCLSTNVPSVCLHVRCCRPGAAAAVGRHHGQQRTRRGGGGAPAPTTAREHPGEDWVHWGR